MCHGMKEFIEKLREYAIKHTKMGIYSVHSIAHWDRVAQNADSLKTSDVDVLVVKAFAYIHDVERKDDGSDILHGPRAAALVDEMRDTELAFLNDDEIRQLKEACELHTTTWRTEDATVNACFDADRLDLGRVGITPNPDKMATLQGRILAERIAQNNPEEDWILNDG